MKCPVCKTKCNTKDYCEDTGYIVESYDKCPVCGYYHEFAYGYGREFIGNKVFKYNYKGELYIVEQKLKHGIYYKRYLKTIKKERKKLYRTNVLKSRVD